MKAKSYRRALGLLELDRGKTYTVVAETSGVALPTHSHWAGQYREKGLKMLEDQPRPGRPIKISAEQWAKITALTCSEPPEGYARWHLRLLANKAVELGYWEAISHTEVASIFKKNELKPHLKRTWCIGKLDSRFLARMELILAFYALPYDPAYPVVCYDERPCQELLEREILSLVVQRKADHIKITWQFSVQAARSKLNSHYVKVQSDNEKFKEI